MRNSESCISNKRNKKIGTEYQKEMEVLGGATCLYDRKDFELMNVKSLPDLLIYTKRTLLFICSS